MIVRKIKEIEIKRTDELFSVAFEMKSNITESAEEVAARLRDRPEGRMQHYFREKWAAFEDDNQTMMAFIGATPYQVQFDGHLCTMTGIGGVSSLAQYRRHGAVRQCFNQCLRDSYDAGVELSALYPFSTAYYRKFGYEINASFTRYSIAMRAIPPFDKKGSVQLMEQGNLTKEAQEIYNSFRQGYNLMALHEDMDDLWMQKADPARDQQYTYVYFSVDHRPKGLMTFTKERIGDPPVMADLRFKMNCSRFWFTDMEGFCGLLNHCLAFSSYYETVVFDLPDVINPIAYLPEWALYRCQREQYFKGMVRVINVSKVLTMAKYHGSGTFAVKIDDPALSENTHTFCVRFVDGKAETVTVDDEAKPDAALSIGDFSRFILGTHSPEELRFVENAKFYAPLEKIGQIFYRKPIYISEYF